MKGGKNVLTDHQRQSSALPKQSMVDDKAYMHAPQSVLNVTDALKLDNPPKPWDST